MDIHIFQHVEQIFDDDDEDEQHNKASKVQPQGGHQAKITPKKLKLRSPLNPRSLGTRPEIPDVSSSSYEGDCQRKKKDELELRLMERRQRRSAKILEYRKKQFDALKDQKLAQTHSSGGRTRTDHLVMETESSEQSSIETSGDFQPSEQISNKANGDIRQLETGTSQPTEVGVLMETVLDHDGVYNSMDVRVSLLDLISTMDDDEETTALSFINRKQEELNRLKIFIDQLQERDEMERIESERQQKKDFDFENDLTYHLPVTFASQRQDTQRLDKVPANDSDNTPHISETDDESITSGRAVFMSLSEAPSDEMEERSSFPSNESCGSNLSGLGSLGTDGSLDGTNADTTPHPEPQQTTPMWDSGPRNIPTFVSDTSTMFAVAPTPKARSRQGPTFSASPRHERDIKPTSVRPSSIRTVPSEERDEYSFKQAKSLDEKAEYGFEQVKQPASHGKSPTMASTTPAHDFALMMLTTPVAAITDLDDIRSPKSSYVAIQDAAKKCMSPGSYHGTPTRRAKERRKTGLTVITNPTPSPRRRSIAPQQTPRHPNSTLSVTTAVIPQQSAQIATATPATCGLGPLVFEERKLPSQEVIHVEIQVQASSDQENDCSCRTTEEAQRAAEQLADYSCGILGVRLF